ncbi:MAG: tRNA uridine-5-carboxymethylaminomethyl(34) synthesis GTPase MnmE [Bacteroidota bacterium]
MLSDQSTIIALATPLGKSAIAVIRLSGPSAIALVNNVFKGKNLLTQPAHTVHFGCLHERGKVVDEVLVTLFKAPRSFTKEDSVEISCHGSPFIIQKIIQLLIDQGARPAKPGEFTQRAFLAGRFDLNQAEAVGNLIEADTALAHQAALHQMRGGFSHQLRELRGQLIHCASMLELGLDFAEEDVDFASENELGDLLKTLMSHIQALIESFKLGHVIKSGVATVITGKPNVGKSTLLNALLGEEKALVSNIAGTTRDVIEEAITLGGVLFRFMDTAGLRKASNAIEAMGIGKAKEKIQSAQLILHLFDLHNEKPAYIAEKIQALYKGETPCIAIGNKVDQIPEKLQKVYSQMDMVLIAAKKKQNLAGLKHALIQKLALNKVSHAQTIVVNTRHYHSLCQSKKALEEVMEGLHKKVSHELVVLDIRKALHHLGEITGEITTEDLLSNIFSQFCIGK